MLLIALRPDHPDLPLDPRCIVQTSVSMNIKSLNNGSYIHVGIKQGLVKRMESGIKPNFLQLNIDINIDGLPVSKSSSVDVWPILGRCIELYDQRPFVIGLFCGSGKPKPLDSYLKDFIDELIALQNDGINYNGQVFRIFVNCFICDAPARAYLKCIKCHTGYNGCERCIQEGTYKDARFGLHKSEVQSDLESNREETLKSSRGRRIKRIFPEDSEEDDPPSKKTSVKAPPVILFSDSSDSESRNQMYSTTKSQECSMKQSLVAKKTVEEPLKKISNPIAIKKHKLFKNISGIVKKQAVKVQLASVSRLKQNLSLQKCNTNMKLDKSLKQISTELSHQSAKTSSASLSMEGIVNREDTVDITSLTKQSNNICNR
ncbi:hypothetical protein ALC62_02282 [Cyphomyrmex costatus]|uniref:Uncharacterized protein n=1 Tax=Cyphomyrmex costatus TaxID=456900 RepID=A0A151IN38_9HYME|nr:hypothetical protein ALC62_02282 [Cyphomyrmex costatus]